MNFFMKKQNKLNIAYFVIIIYDLSAIKHHKSCINSNLLKTVLTNETREILEEISPPLYYTCILYHAISIDCAVAITIPPSYALTSISSMLWRKWFQNHSILYSAKHKIISLCILFFNIFSDIIFGNDPFLGNLYSMLKKKILNKTLSVVTLYV